MLIQGRSDGDGMEYTYYPENTFPRKQASSKHDFSDCSYSKNFAPLSKRKEPKFVPYEPYKAAVSPIMSTSKKSEAKSPHLVIDSQKVSSLASSIIQFNASRELNALKKDGNDSLKNWSSANNKECKPECTVKMKNLEEKITRLENEKKELQSQFKIQTEVDYLF